MDVLRLKAGDGVLAFNGRDGEWRCALSQLSKKLWGLTPEEFSRSQTPPGDLHYLFAPLKRARLDYMVQKAVEMGVSKLQPVLTQHTQSERVNGERMRANAIEAAEQCGILSVPEVEPPVSLDVALKGWDATRKLIYCDEQEASRDPIGSLGGVESGPVAVLIGPEGGFSDRERNRLLAQSFVVPLSLGPRIMRADTAAVAVLALVNAVLGDWRRP